MSSFYILKEVEVKVEMPLEILLKAVDTMATFVKMR